MAPYPFVGTHCSSALLAALGDRYVDTMACVREESANPCAEAGSKVAGGWV